MKRFFLAAAALSALATRTTAQFPPEEGLDPYNLLGEENIFLHLDFEGLTPSTDKSPGGGNLGKAIARRSPRHSEGIVFKTVVLT